MQNDEILIRQQTINDTLWRACVTHSGEQLVQTSTKTICLLCFL